MENIIIIENQKTLYHIVHSKNSSECERFACKELQKYLYQSLDTPIPVFSDKCDKRGPEILIGNARNNNLHLKLAKDSPEAFLIEICNNDIIITGNSPRAILYAVYHLLEELIGFKCFTSDCEVYNHLDILTIEKDYSYHKDFSFEYREAYFTGAFDGGFAAKNMLNSNLADLGDKYGNKMKWYNFHHSFSDLINPDEYFEEHPEYFSLIDGKRVKEHTELCLSNPDVFNLCLEKLKSWIKNNPYCDYFSVAQDEWMGHFTKMACECENCKKIDNENGSQSGSVITFVNKLASAIEQEFPNKYIHTFAYQYSRKTPSLVKPHRNVVVRLCNIECSWSRSIEESAKLNTNSESAKFYQDLLNWSKITPRLYIWDYAVNFRNYLLPFPNLRTMEKNINLYRKVGVKGVLMQGNFSYGGGGYLDELKAYVIARLLSDDKRELDKLIYDFCSAYYGKESCEFIIQYINLWENQVQNYELWLYDDADHEMFTDEVIKKSIKLLKTAYELAENDIIKKRIDKLMLGMEYAYLVRLDMDVPNRSEQIDAFKQKILKHRITEIFERTALDFSIDVMKKSRYAKNRSGWYSLYYIMK